MQEVSIILKFITPCLGNVRGEDLDKMLRNSKGEVIFMQSWWHSAMNYASKAMAKYYDSVKGIQWDPVIDGHVTLYKRYYSDTQYKTHEAFTANSMIGINAMLPDDLPLEDFKELLRIAGTYVGITPYGWKYDYGRFEVVSVSPKRRPKSGDKSNCEKVGVVGGSKSTESKSA